MGFDAAWNGVIVPRGGLSDSEVVALEKYGIRRVQPVWSDIFQKVRGAVDACLREPYEPHFSFTISCPCFKCMEELFGAMGLEIKVILPTFGLVVTRDDLKEGDLLFFRDARLPSYSRLSPIDHVAIVTDLGTVFHPAAYQKAWEGRVDDLLENGVFVIGRRLIGEGELTTFRVPAVGRDEFSLENTDYLRSFLQSPAT
ncbi:hypothetical protein HY622_02370 [Candidatus Uhrbacteria bacterium]|nr:hypothetical protein [Candidatus Uhrbacteria bacterium]